MPELLSAPPEMFVNYEANQAGRDFVIGDLHGSYSAFEILLAGLKFDPSVDRIFSVGDLADQGPESVRCLKLLNEPWFHAVFGNHEEFLLASIKDDPIKFWWLPNGGMWAKDFVQYCHNLKFDRDLSTTPTSDFLEFLEIGALVDNLPVVINLKKLNGETVHIVHSELPTEVPVSDDDLQSSERIIKLAEEQLAPQEGRNYFCWGRERFGHFIYADLSDHARILRTAKYHSYVCRYDHLHGLVIGGHSKVQAPIQIGNSMCIDTGAHLMYEAHKKIWPTLTAYEVNTDKFYSARLSGEVNEVECKRFSLNDILADK